MDNSPLGVAARLRKKIDSEESFSRGHQILKIRRQKRIAPEWAKDDVRIQEILLRSFPKLKTNEKQRARAGRWMRIIKLYFQMGWTHGQIAEELSANLSTIQSLIRSIKRAFKDQKANGTGAVGYRPRGRQKMLK